MGRGSASAGDMKNYKKHVRGLVSVNVIRPAVSAGWQPLKLRFYPPTETGRQGLYPS